MFCKYCGRCIPDDAIYCCYCGQKLATLHQYETTGGELSRGVYHNQHAKNIHQDTLNQITGIQSFERTMKDFELFELPVKCATFSNDKYFLKFESKLISLTNNKSHHDFLDISTVNAFDEAIHAVNVNYNTYRNGILLIQIHDKAVYAITPEGEPDKTKPLQLFAEVQIRTVFKAKDMLKFLEHMDFITDSDKNYNEETSLHWTINQIILDE